MIIKKIELEVRFKDDFVPAEIYYEENNHCNGDCPFWASDFELGGWCCIATDGEECPIKKYFDK